MIGDILQKSNLNEDEYSKLANWCNENDALIVDRGDFYEVREIPHLSTEELAKKEAISLRAQLESYLSDTDYAVIKCGELKLDLETEYPGLSEKRAQARAKINELESEYAELRMAKPAYPILE
nr:MAG TPA: hypothetical protein [Caudoviricetes sp.]